MEVDSPVAEGSTGPDILKHDVQLAEKKRKSVRRRTNMLDHRYVQQSLQFRKYPQKCQQSQSTSLPKNLDQRGLKEYYSDDEMTTS